MNQPAKKPGQPELLTDARRFAEKLQALATEAGRLGYTHESRTLTELANDLEAPIRRYRL